MHFGKRTLVPLSVWFGLLGACSSGPKPQTGLVVRPGSDGAIESPAAQARADSGRRAYTRADVEFMAGMIEHHGQAVLMSQWAPANGANEAIRVLAARIIVAQRDEILLMQSWLRDRKEKVPDGNAEHQMHGMAHTLHPGMLSTEQMTELKNAKGTEFDRLFLIFMIQHHAGAIAMVDKLLSSHGAAQDVLVFKLASDVSADQGSEIDRMRSMLVEMGKTK